MMNPLVEAALRSLALAAAVWLGMTIARVRSPHIAKGVWTAVLLFALAMPILMRWPGAQAIPVSVTLLSEVSIRGAAIGAHLPWGRTLAIAYGIVASALFVRLALGFLHMWRMRRRAVRLQEDWTHGHDIRASDQLRGPVTFGATILLPADFVTWSELKRTAILAHEREHVRSHDCQVQWLAAVHLCVFWFSPLSWWLRAHLGKLAEHTSDDAALRQSVDRVDYAAVLLEAARCRSAAASPAVAMARGADVTGRIDRVLSGRIPDEIPAAWRRALAVGAVLPVLALIAGARAPQAGGADAAAAEADTSAPKARIVAAVPMEEWYPTGAKRQGVNGLVRVAVTLDVSGLATDAQVVSESPEGFGFGAAAENAARTFTYENPTGHATTLIFAVKFELKDGSPHYGTTNFEGH